MTGITAALSPTALAAFESAVDRAVAAGVPVSFDVNHRASLWRDRDAAPVCRSLVAPSTIVSAGLDEARMLVDDENATRVATGIAALGVNQETPSPRGTSPS